MDIETLRKLVAMDEEDALSRFALGQKLAEQGTPEALAEAAEHLGYANQKDPSHLAAYYQLASVLIELGRKEEAVPVLEKGIEKTTGVPENSGGDLKPVMEEMLEKL